MNNALSKYKNDNKIHSISGFNYNKSYLKIPKKFNDTVFLTKRDCSCGWGTWKKVWNKVDWNINNYGN